MKMQRPDNGNRVYIRAMAGSLPMRAGMTLLEMVIAMAIVVVILTAILPVFRSMRNSWDTKQAVAETLQNSRVLIDHLNYNLSKAVRITDVSDSNEIIGYIQFEDNDSNEWRYEIGGSNLVKFGLVGDLSDLAGPVSQLQFTCYDGNDFNNPTTDVNSIRFVEVNTTLTNSATLGQDKTFTASIYLRTNSVQGTCWQNQDIGNVGAAGSATQSDDSWTIEGSGEDIFQATDEFHYVYQSLSDDGQIIARVVSIENTNFLAKAGVMIRETLDGNSKYAGIFVTPSYGVYFQYRTSTGGLTNYNWPGYSAQAPCWFKVTRSGNTFAGYVSSDDSAWTQVGSSVSITMATDAYIGMAVCSHNDGVLCTAEFDNISFNTITYETFSEANVGTDSTSITIDLTPDTSEGDLLIAAVATDGDTSDSIEAPSGWTLIDRGTYDSKVTLGAWWKLAGASEPNHTFTWSGDEQAYGWMMRFTGHNSTNPINAYSADGDSDIAPISPAVTATVNNCLILRLGAFDDDDITVDDPGLSSHTAITMDESSQGTCWQNQDIGDVGAAGSASFAGGTWTIKGSGEDIFNRADEFYYVYQSLSDDGQIIARVVSIENTNFLAKAGVMIRETLDGSSKYAGIFVTPNYGVYFQRRTSTGGTTSFTSGSSSHAPRWFKVTRSGSTFRGYESADGSIWTQVGSSVSISMASDVYIGLAVCSHYDGVLCTAEFDNVTAPCVTAGDTVSGGAGYVMQSSAGSSGTSNFSLGSSNEAQMLTIAIAPDSASCDDSIRP